jgi:hypothetical protein
VRASGYRESHYTNSHRCGWRLRRVGRGILTEPLVAGPRLRVLLTSHRLGRDTSPYHGTILENLENRYTCRREKLNTSRNSSYYERRDVGLRVSAQEVPRENRGREWMQTRADPERPLIAEMIDDRSGRGIKDNRGRSAECTHQTDRRT